jgi:hypothetical protein
MGVPLNRRSEMQTVLEPQYTLRAFVTLEQAAALIRADVNASLPPGLIVTKVTPRVEDGALIGWDVEVNPEP